MPDITSDAHQLEVRRFRQIFAAYRQNQDLIAVGAYRKGADPRVDEAIAMRPAMLEFLRQGSAEPVDLAASFSALEQLLGGDADAADNGT